MDLCLLGSLSESTLNAMRLSTSEVYYQEGDEFGLNHVITNYCKSFICSRYVRCATLMVSAEGMPWPKTAEPNGHPLYCHSGKGRAIKGLIVCNS